MTDKERLEEIKKLRKMIIQTFKTHCLGCGEEVKCEIIDLAADNEIIVDFMQGMEFKCDCGTTTCVNVDFYENNY